MWARARKVIATISTPRPEPTEAEIKAKTAADQEAAKKAAAERAKDLQQRQDAEYQAMVESANAAFIEQLLRDRYVWPGDASPSLEDHRERLRQSRGERRW